MVFMTLLVLSSTTYIVHAFNKAALNLDRDVKTRQALERARDALIAYAAKPDRDSPGHLPCPDRTQDPTSEDYGKAEDNCGTLKTRVGRLPWKTLGIEELRDGHGEPLWYAMSRCFLKRNGDKYCGQYLINSNTQGQLSVAGTDASDAVAIIFSAGAPLPGQDRTPGSPAFIDVANYLEGENADGGAPPIEEEADPIVDSRDYFEVRPRCEWDTCGAHFNDQLLAVRNEEYFPVLEAYVQSRIEREIRPLLEKHHSFWGAYPYAAPFDGREARREDQNSPAPSLLVALPPLLGEQGTHTGMMPLNLHSKKDELEGWQLSCSPSTGDSKSNVRTRNRSASRLSGGACRIRMDICREASSAGSIEATLLTRTNALDRGFFEKPVLTEGAPPIAAAAAIQSGSVNPSTGQGRVSVRITPPSVNSWPLCNTCNDDDGDDCDDDEEEDDGGSGSWKSITVTIDPPRLIEALNNPTDSLEWFFKNEWYRVIGYHRAVTHEPEPDETLTINYQGEPPIQVQAPAAIVMAGSPYAPATRIMRRADPQQCSDGNVPTAQYLSAFFEGANVQDCQPVQLLSATSETAPFNDRVIPLSALPSP